jgi:Calx-beta domain
MRFNIARPRKRVAMLIAALAVLALVPGAAQATVKPSKLRFSSLTYHVTEPTSGTSVLTATVLRTGNTNVAASVQYATQDGTATAGVDYIATSGTLNFAAGETRKTIAVTVLHDGIMGPNSKSLSLKLSNGLPTPVPPGQATATVTIFDTDGPGTIDFASPTYSVVESAGVATITVTRASASNLVETVDYTTTELPAATGHATAGDDYTTTSGTLTFATGEMSKTFQVPINDDSSFEGDETLQLTLSNPKNLTSADQPVLGPDTPATLTIVDDDIPTFAFHQATYSVNEDAGNATITVDRGGDTAIAASVGYATSDGTAVAGTDYTATSGQLDFAAGQTQASFQVPITLNGVANEPNKTLNLALSANGQQVDSALLSIVEADPGTTNNSVQLSNNAYSVGEGDGTVNVTVTLAHDPASPVTVHLATGAVSDTATADSDYTSIADQTVTFQPGGSLSQQVPITILEDNVTEDDETFSVKLSSPSSGVVIGDPGNAKVTILDDDSSGTLDFSAQRYDVNEKAGQATITVRRTGGTAGMVSVDYATLDGTAHAPGDYTAASGTLTFAAGETTKTFAVPVAWDGLAEGDETVSIGLSNFASDDDPGAIKAAVLHIADDGASGPVQFSAASYNVLENAGAATITVNRSGGSLGGPVTVDYAGSDGTNGTLTFAPGESSKTFQVPVVDDRVHTGARTVSLSLSNPGGGTSLGNQATATLTIGDVDPISSTSKDRTPPKLKVTAKKLQRLAAKALVLKVRSNEAAKLRVGLRVRAGKKLVKVAAAASKRVGAGKTVTIKLKLSARALSRLRAALVHGKAKVTLVVTGTDVAGNKATVRKTITVK